MKKHNQLKIIAFSLGVMITGPAAWAGLGGLQVKSSLGEPFSGTIVVTGDEAKALLKQGKPNISGAALHAQVVQQGENAVIRLQSSQAMRDPLFSFNLSVGSQGRQYTALLDPPNYQAASGGHRAARESAADEQSGDRSKNRHAGKSKAAHADRHDGRNATGPITGKHYTVGAQENLIDVARKVQPQGLSLGQTMRALVRANPHSFRNGNPDILYKNSTLIIPSAEKMRQLVNAKGAVTSTAKSEAHATQPAPNKTQAATPQAQNAKPTPAPVEAPKPATSRPQPAAAPKTPEAKPTETKPAESTATPNTATASAASAAQPAPEPVAPPVEQPKPTPAPEPTPAPVPEPAEEGGFFSGWHGYALLGGVGVLLILALLWWRRRQNGAGQYDEDTDGGLPPDDEALAASDEEFDDDDVVFVDVGDSAQSFDTKPSTPAPTEPTQPPKAAPAAQQAVPVAEAPASSVPETEVQNNDDDWSWLNDSDADTAAVTPKAELAQPKVAEQAASKTTILADDDWLKFDVDESFSAKNNAATDAPVSNEKAGSDTAADTDDLEWLTETVETPQASTAAVMADAQPQPAAASKADDALADVQWDSLSFDADNAAPAEPVVEKPAKPELKAATTDTADDGASNYTRSRVLDPQHQNAFASVGDAVTEDIDWSALGLADDSPAATAQTTAAPAVSKPAVETVASDSIQFSPEPPVQQKPVADTTSKSQKEPAADALEFATVSADEVAIDFAPVAEKAPEVKPTATKPQSAPVAESFESYTAEVESAKAVTPRAAEPIDQTVPMRAKLELAKMYLEIDDAVTARKTLRELLDEANGEILAESQQLLQQIDG